MSDFMAFMEGWLPFQIAEHIADELGFSLGGIESHGGVSVRFVASGVEFAGAVVGKQPIGVTGEGRDVAGEDLVLAAEEVGLPIFGAFLIDGTAGAETRPAAVFKDDEGFSRILAGGPGHVRIEFFQRKLAFLFLRTVTAYAVRLEKRHNVFPVCFHACLKSRRANRLDLLLRLFLGIGRRVQSA